MTDLLIIFLKWPEAGRVKTRIGRVIGYPEAANIYRRMVSAIIRNISPIFDDGLKICWYYDPLSKGNEVEKWIKNELGTLNVTNFSNHLFYPQIEGDLGDKLKFIFDKSFSLCFQRVLAIGSDCVSMTDKQILTGFISLNDKRELVFGPCLDGGYYLVGMNNPKGSIVFHDVPWSTNHVLNKSLNIAEMNQISYSLIEELDDVDKPEDLQRYSFLLNDIDC